MKKIFIIVGMCIVCIFSINAQNVIIRFDSIRQVIRGFGGIHINSWTGRQLSPDMLEKAFGNNPGEIGLSIFRMQVSDDTTAWKNELPIAKYASEKGAIVFASPWNAPAYMRIVRGTYNNETDYKLLEEFYDDYAEHLNRFIAFMAANSVPLYAISIQNEPDWHGWTTWTRDEMIKFLRENAQTIQCKIIAPESYGYSRSFINPLLNDSLANSRIDILGTHIYGTSKSDYYYPLAYEKGKEIWMTEHLLGSDSPQSNNWIGALQLADEINTCMDANMSAYVYWYIRRFYGLIDDAGNITDKGYVMSHFSKFIRPNSERIGLQMPNILKVSITAYRTDSSLSVVIVNTNTQPVQLTFKLSHVSFTIDSIFKFVSTSAKKMVNEGAIILSNGEFTTTFDAQSITTLVTHPIGAARFGNLPPIAMAGNDTTIIDTVGSGVQINLSALQSFDPDGIIVKYNWAKDGLQVANTSSYPIKLKSGKHTFVLTVTDNDGAVSSDTVIVEVKSNKTTEIWFEAECTTLGDKWDLIKNANASNGYYLTVNPSYESTTAPVSDTLQYLNYRFFITEGGLYKVWGRVLAPTPNDDSFWVRMDHGDWIMWNNIPGSSTWVWDDIHNQSNDNDTAFLLNEGYHTLTIAYRENGTAVDKWYITNTGSTPSGIGGTAEACYNENNITGQQKVIFHLFPNPSSNYVSIKGTEPITQINIYNTSGLLLYKQKNVSKQFTTLQLNLPEGLYLVQIISSTGKSQYEKLIIRK